MKRYRKSAPAKVEYMKGGVMTNAVEPAAPASVWGKGCAGKGMPSTNNSRIYDGVFERELKEYQAKSKS